MTRSFWAPAVLAIAAGLVLLLATAAPWISGTDERSVGGVVVAEPTATPGTAYAPAAMALGAAGLVLGIGLTLLRGGPRRVVAALVGGAGMGAVVAVVAGLAAAARAAGTVTPSPVFAAVAAAALFAAGWVGWRGPGPPPRASRYRVADERAGDDEWSLAADDDGV